MIRFIVGANGSCYMYPCVLGFVFESIKRLINRHVVYQLQDQAVADEKVPFSFQVGWF